MLVWEYSVTGRTSAAAAAAPHLYACLYRTSSRFLYVLPKCSQVITLPFRLLYLKVLHEFNLSFQAEVGPVLSDRHGEGYELDHIKSNNLKCTVRLVCEHAAIQSTKSF